MKTAVALPGKLQVINGDGEFSSRTASFVSESRNYLLEANSELKNYTVISIIGPQSSGKSYLLNSLFEAKFDVLNAAEERKQTTKGIWIARCTHPSMVIMDVEGFDGKERGEDDTLFERQSALFSLIVSDVLLLNMWFTDVGRQKGANIELIELILKERVNIDATKTTIVILVRDYQYKTPPGVIKKQLEKTINEIWRKVNPPTRNRRMSDYIEVIVKDIPSSIFQEEYFDQKCKDLSNFLCSFAENENKEQTEYGSGFAISSEDIWDRIRSNKEIIAADHKIAKSEYQCKKITKSLLGSLDQEKGHWLSDLSIPVKRFSAEFSLIYKDILTRYEEQITASIMRTVRDEKKDKLEKKLLKRIQSGLHTRMHDLASKTLSYAKSELHPVLEKLATLDSSTAKEVIQPYLKIFDENAPSAADLKQVSHQDCRLLGLTEIRMKFVHDLTKHAEVEIYDIQICRSIGVSRRIVKEMTDLFDQEARDWMTNLNIPAKQFTEKFSILRKHILTRYEEQTASLSSTVRDAEKAELEERLHKRFQEGLYVRLDILANTILASAMSKNLKKELKKLKVLNYNSVVEVLRSYLAVFDDKAPNDTDLEWCPYQEHVMQHIKLNIRQQFVTELTEFAEKKANKIKSRRDFTSGIKNMAKLVLGTAWAAITGDTSVLISSVAAMAARNAGKIALLGYNGRNRITWAPS